MFIWLKALFAAQSAAPPAAIEHPQFGRMMYEDDFCSGAARHAERSIPFHVTGTATEPDPRCLAELSKIIDNWMTLEAQALAVLCPPEALPVVPAEFHLGAVVVSWPDKPGCWYFEYELEKDPGSVWRVEFVDGVARDTGRDL